MKARWRYLLPSMAVMLVMGVLYAWSILKVPFAQEFSWTKGQLGVNFTFTISLFRLESLLVDNTFNAWARNCCC